LLGSALYAVGIAQRQLHVILGIGLQIEEAAGKLVGYHMGKSTHDVVHLLSAQAQEWQACAPLTAAGATVLQLHGGVAIGIAVDVPAEAGSDQGGGLDHEFTGDSSVLGLRLHLQTSALQQGDSHHKQDSTPQRKQFHDSSSSLECNGQAGNHRSSPYHAMP
jgi:hypothetical protein